MHLGHLTRRASRALACTGRSPSAPAHREACRACVCTGTHPFMAPNREALAGNGLPVANALDKTVANNNMLVLAHDSVGHSLGIAGCLGDGVGCQCGHSSWRLLRVAGPLLLLARRAL